jgi:hypothetical protein
LNSCEEISDEIKEARFIIIQSLNGKEITLDIVIKYLAILSLERMNWNDKAMSDI